MKISFIEPHLGLYGGIRRIIEFSNRLKERGHDVTIFHSDGSQCNWMQCFVKIKPNYKVLEEKHDVIIFNDPNPIDYKLAVKSKSRLKIFYVLELYEKDLLKGFNKKIYHPSKKRMFILKQCLLSSFIKLVNATWEKEWLKENANINSAILFGGINTKMFYPLRITKKEENDGIIILCSGDNRKRKGTETIIEAVSIAKKIEPKIILDTYFGKGIPQEKMAEKYCSADIFIEASISSGWNNPVAEAMACKVPVICTDIGGVKDFAFDGETALLVPPNNPEAIANSIIKIIKNRELKEKLINNAFQKIQQFDWNKNTQKFEKIMTHELSKNKINLLYFIPNAIKKNLNIVLNFIIKKIFTLKYFISKMIK